jgi:uncharacterized protein (DUF433 family)
LVFVGSRVPIAALFENLDDGITAQEFTEIFPGIKLEQVKSILDFAAKNSLYATLEGITLERIS